jgi:hypothetical protein
VHKKTKLTAKGFAGANFGQLACYGHANYEGPPQRWPFVMKVFGGAEGDRTPDLMTASHALSQLSYGPIGFNSSRFFVKEIERMTIEKSFEQFLQEKGYLKNVSKHSVSFSKQSFKAFNLQEPLTQGQLNGQVMKLLKGFEIRQVSRTPTPGGHMALPGGFAVIAPALLD